MSGKWQCTGSEARFAPANCCSGSESSETLPPERERFMDDEPPDFVLATYKEIAARFGLGAPSAARVKVKRAGWITEPPNHPADPRRIRVPRGAWEKAAETPSSAKPETPGSKPR